MKTFIKISFTDFIELDTDDIITIEESSVSNYNKYTDEKWIKFCKDHNFNPDKDANSKIYDLYLEYCINNMI